MLRGRHSECEALDRLLACVRAGRSGALVLRGESGVGKSALFEHVVERASGCRVARAAGVQSEMELAFAGLHQLCAPLLDWRERLAGPQRDALATAFGLRAGIAPDPFLIGLAVLGLLAEVAEERPLVCLVDDAQWLDRASAQVLGFVARRLQAESVGLLFATREPNDARELSGLPELMVGGLRDADARALLSSVIRGPLDERVRDRIVAETYGNPLALLELPRGLTAAELVGGFGLPDPRPLSGRIEESFLRRLEALAPDTRRLVLIAATEPVGDPVLVWRAAARLGVGHEALEPAATAGLLEIGARVRFRHPLVRSAALRSASLQERRSVHGALAEATDAEADPDRRAWHRARAASGPDEDVAGELERSASLAQARGGLAAAAAFLEKATELTLEPARRARRAVAAAQAKLQAGAPDAALALLAAAEAGPLDELQRAQVELLRAHIAFAVNRDRHAPALLLKAAELSAPLDVALARDTYLDALAAAIHVGRLADDCGLREVALAARAAPSPSRPARATDLLLDGLALLIAEGYAAGAPIAKRALRAFRSDLLPSEEGLRWLSLASHTALVLWDDETWEALATRHVELARHAGALAVLPIALNSRVGVHLGAGELAAARSVQEEAKALTEVTGSRLPPYVGLALAGLRGQEAEVSRSVEATMTEVLSRGEGMGLAVAHWARAVLYNGLGRYEDALVAVQETGDHPEELWFSSYGSIELIEAAARSGKAERAAMALERLSETTHASGTELALGMEARSRALLSESEVAERLYREAIDRLAQTRVRVELARAHLVYGEWLRRERRRTDAREQLRTAHEMLTAMGLEAFAERARRELLATGETVRKRTVETLDELTAQEAQIARLAAAGHTNPEIGAQLFISPRTVEWHLGKVFTKLAITSRRELRHALPDSRRTAVPA